MENTSKWTKEDEKFLEENYHSKSFEYLMIKLNRTKYSIQNKAQKLKIKREKCKYSNSWEKEEEDMLLKIYRTSSREELLNIFNDRNWGSIKSKASKLGIKRAGVDWSDEDLKFLKENYYNTNLYVLVEKFNKTESQIRKKAKMLGLKFIKEIEVTKEQHNFIVDNYDTFTDNEISELIDLPRYKVCSYRLSLGNKKRDNYSEWTKEEEDFLIDNYKDMAYEDIGKSINRSESAIIKRAISLNLHKTNLWSESETEYLNKNYENLDIIDIMKHLNRNYNSIASKANTLGLQKRKSPRFYSKKELSGIKKMFLKGDTILSISEIFDRDRREIYKRLKDMNLYESNHFGKCQKYDGEIFNSFEELDVYKFIKSCNVDIKRNKSNFYYKYNRYYIPDFIINKDIIVEYYGLYTGKKSNSKIINNYNIKTHKKNAYYNSLKDYSFIAIYPEDLKNNFSGVFDKIKHLIKT